MPWPPGRRELGFTYVIENQHARRQWQRPLDLPTRELQVTVSGADPQHITSNLVRSEPHDSTTVIFASEVESMAAGEKIEVQLDRLPVPLVVRLRRTALIILAGVALVFVRILRQSRRGEIDRSGGGGKGNTVSSRRSRRRAA